MKMYLSELLAGIVLVVAFIWFLHFGFNIPFKDMTNELYIIVDSIKKIIYTA
jgi:hypothetical protein